jgi:hypothetical protein
MEDLKEENIYEKQRATSQTYGEEVMREDDPQGLYIPINELAYEINETRMNIKKINYWIEWIMEYERVCRQNKIKCEITRRNDVQVDPKHQKDVGWIIWDIIKGASEKKKVSELTKRIIKSTKTLFVLKYKPSSWQRKRALMQMSIRMMEMANVNIEIITASQLEELQHNKEDNIRQNYRPFALYPYETASEHPLGHRMPPA